MVLCPCQRDKEAHTGLTGQFWLQHKCWQPLPFQGNQHPGQAHNSSGKFVTGWEIPSVPHLPLSPFSWITQATDLGWDLKITILFPNNISQSVPPGSASKKESRALTSLFTLSWEEKNLKTSAFLSRGLIVNYTGKRGKKKKERKHSEEENNLKLLKPMQTLAHSHFSLRKQWFMPQIWGQWCKTVFLHRIRLCWRINPQAHPGASLGGFPDATCALHAVPRALEQALVIRRTHQQSLEAGIALKSEKFKHLSEEPPLQG